MNFKHILAILLLSIVIFVFACKRPNRKLPDVRNQIVFVSNRYGNYDLFTMDIKTNKVRQLTDTPDKTETLPGSSRNGRKIGYFSNDGHSTHVIIMNSDGSAKKRIISGRSNETGFAFSKDSKKVSIVSNKDGDYELYLANTDGSNIKKLTDNKTYDGGSEFSINDHYIFWVVARDIKSPTDIYRMDADGSNKVQYTNTPLEEGVDTISYDEKWLTVSAIRDNNWEILIFSWDGKKVKRFTKNNYYDARAMISPKNYKLVWTTNKNKHWDIMLGDIRVPNKGINITKGKGDNFGPKWSPDGKRIVFESNRSGHWQLYTVDADGSGLKQITKGNYDNREPSWLSR